MPLVDSGNTIPAQGISATGAHVFKPRNNAIPA